MTAEFEAWLKSQIATHMDSARFWSASARLARRQLVEFKGSGALVIERSEQAAWHHEHVRLFLTALVQWRHTASEDMIRRLFYQASDPMWADHCEMHKRFVEAVAVKMVLLQGNLRRAHRIMMQEAKRANKAEKLALDRLRYEVAFKAYDPLRDYMQKHHADGDNLGRHYGDVAIRELDRLKARVAELENILTPAQKALYLS